MARGRSLIWLSIILAVGAAASWTAQRTHAGPAQFRVVWPALALSAAIALSLWVVFYALGRTLHKARPDAARSMVHLQTVATAIVAIIAIGGLMGGFQSALVGLGIVGFGLTLALQRPILAVAGWASVAVGGSVRVGDRIRVGDLQGDVLDITLFTTKMWEVGGPDSATPGRPTGRILSLSNATFIEHPISNATSDTPVIFDEFVVNVAFEGDLELARRLLDETGQRVLNLKDHADVADRYRRLTRGLAMEADFPERPIVFMQAMPSWMELRLRYLVDARKAGRVQSKLTDAWMEATATHAGALPPSYPRTQTMRIGGAGRPLDE